MDKSRTDELTERIEELVLSGTYADGARLDETRLAERFGVSRTPIREAIQRLALGGLVELRPRRGAFVSRPGGVALIEMFEVMAELEAVCARLAADVLSDEGLEALRAANRACAEALAEEDADAYYAANERFHHTIYAQCGNRFLEGEALRLHRRLRPYRRLQLRLRGRLRQSMAEHEAILAALAEGDAEAAAAAIRDHVAVQGGKFRRLMATIPVAAE